MLVQRFYDEQLAQASFLIACQKCREAIVVDPARDITPYLELAERDGLRIRYVTETHIHADFVSGTRELAAATNATPLLSAEGGAGWQYEFAQPDGAELLHDGDTITIGRVSLRAIHTPGHTPEHLCFVLTDGARSDDPVALISGDLLFVGDVGRPDLLETAAGIQGTKEAAAHDLYRSLQRLGSLPDHVQVWPGHGAGSACGKALGALPTSTLGYERLTNWALLGDDESTFVAKVLEGQPLAPPYFARMKRINREGPTVLGTADTAKDLVTPSLGWSEDRRAIDQGAVLDVRDAASHAAGHLPGSINIPFNAVFTRWAGWVVDDRPLALVADSADTAAAVVRALRAIGTDHVTGIFGADALDAARRAGALRSTQRAPMSSLAALQADGVLIVDVRNDDEWQRGHIDGAVHHPFATMPASLADLSHDTRIAVHCASGARSAIAASLLDAAGYRCVIDLYDGWSPKRARTDEG